ncbi:MULTISPECIES: hypothetical protein [Aerosakkonema]|uniref:hypothetical protein n=1 Tax=Aerosakkonema TaxID=1246629 RepID=UPI0035B77663
MANSIGSSLLNLENGSFWAREHQESGMSNAYTVRIMADRSGLLITLCTREPVKYDN